jgi:hypothetical protein
MSETKILILNVLGAFAVVSLLQVKWDDRTFDDRINNFLQRSQVVDEIRQVGHSGVTLTKRVAETTKGWVHQKTAEGSDKADEIIERSSGKAGREIIPRFKRHRQK